MNKRSAMLIAAGLVLTLGIGGLAVSLGLTGPTPAGAAETAQAQRVAQISLSSPGTVDSDDAGEEHQKEGQEHESEDHGTFETRGRLMSDGRRRLARKGALRLTAWSSAAAAFLASWAVLGTLPKPTTSLASPRAEAPQVVVIRKVLRRVIVPPEEPVAPAPPAVTFSPGSSGSSIPPPPTSTGGS